MDLYGKNILIASAYGAEYGGNFLKSLTALGKKLRCDYSCNVYFVFPDVGIRDWIEILRKSFTVECVNLPYKNTTKELVVLLRKWNIDLIHSHFEAFDVPLAKAIMKVNPTIKQVWHLHDNLTLNKQGLNLQFLRKCKTHIEFIIHYGFYGRKAFFVPCGMQLGYFENHYRNHIFSFPNENLSIEELESVSLTRGQLVVNGIDLERINSGHEYTFPEGTFRFLTYGGNTFLKGIHILLDACEIVLKQNRNFSLSVTKGSGTEDYIKKRYNNNLPFWLQLLNQTDNITSFFDTHSCFVSASFREGCCYATGEAAIYGMPTIQSDIAGTWYNRHNPSTFLFEVGNAEDLARQMESVMLSDKKELLEKCKISSALTKNVLSLDRWVTNIIDIYKKQ